MKKKNLVSNFFIALELSDCFKGNKVLLSVKDAKVLQLNMKVSRDVFMIIYDQNMTDLPSPSVSN